MAERDYYEVLGVSRDATPEQIKKAYRRLARQYHPDLHPGDKAAEAKFKELSAAHDALSDPEKRKLYDQFGSDGLKAGFAGAGGAGAGPFTRGPGGFQHQYTTQGNPFEGFDFSQFRGTGGAESIEDLISGLFGGRTRRGRPRRGAEPSPEALRGTDVETEIRLTFEQAARGVGTDITLKHAGGRNETLSVEIPPGVVDGQRIRLRGKGQASHNGGSPGDLYVVCRVADHPWFRRDGRDIVIDLPVSPTEAMLGAAVDVPTLDGMATVTIPPGASSGQKLRLRGRGVHAHKDRPAGDQFVVIRIVVPKTLDDEGRQLLQQFQSHTDFNPRKDVPWAAG